MKSLATTMRVCVACCAWLAIAGPAAAHEAHGKTSRAAEIAALSSAASDLAAAWKAKDAPRVVSHFADDATTMEPGGPATTGIANIKKFVFEAVKDPGFSLNFSSSKVDAAASGDLGYTRGPFTLTYTDPQTQKIQKVTGSFVAIFKKQKDGSWKVVEDISTPSG